MVSIARGVLLQLWTARKATELVRD
jgi:hypothetical protein